MNACRRWSALPGACLLASACLAQPAQPSVLDVTRRSSFFSENARRESADAVIRSMQAALAAGADLHEVDAYGNSAFSNVLWFASWNTNGDEANPIVAYLIGAGIDVNAGISMGKYLPPLCMPILVHTFNTKLVILLMEAGARKNVHCADRGDPETIARDDPLDSPVLSNLLKQYK